MMVSLYSTKLPHQLNQARTFIACRIKWVSDPYLDTPSISSISTTQSSLNSSPPLALPFHIKLTPQAFSLHKEEQLILKSQPLRDDTVKRFKYDLGLPHDYITALLSDYPEYFNVCEDKDCLTNNDSFFLELVSWKDELAVSEMEKRVSLEDLRNVKRGERIGFPLNFPDGFDLKKKVRDWVFEWQGLPYISPYENAFHLNPNGDQAEKWTVTVLHELLWLLVSKKTEKENVLRLGDYLGFGNRFSKALVHHPGIFYVSNKIRTQTVVLREAYRKGFLVHKHPLMGMRFRYIRLMSKAKKKRRKSVGGVSHSQLQRQVSSTKKGIERNAKYKSREEENGSSESEFEDVGSSDSNLEGANNDGTRKMKM
ncbi:UBIQUITIN CARBOXYL-TERMINAL HYDROLASE FAMILY PROTEIN [Salix koriyanagi]|uniref:UBIQUITIN CARBOXYL-TERMINAL HYDROLASE FAMILY PROTEIN n=1 Tax=Salix koriyanagi TaxID=2511006 RepID=A0A9Q0Q620_9ROSI|nr:UBIQUITIN CARBOXYL-TERMINAL HYDROLASE FAMILY PROTEIN [Salix koriyanagi]